jgi:predicted alpha/beta superfamily hydrolase
MTGFRISNDESPLADTEVHYLRSECVGDEFKLFVGHCGNTDKARPVVVFSATLPSVSAAQWTSPAPWSTTFPILMVGIGYRDALMQEAPARRTRDFTPTVAPACDVAADMMGGGARFLAFIGDELQPWVRTHNEVDADDSAFIGHSFGGLFGLYVLLSEPATFKRYGIGSPALQWDNYVMFEKEAAYARAHDDPAAKVFPSVGAYENPEASRRLLVGLPADLRAEVESDHTAWCPSPSEWPRFSAVALTRVSTSTVKS